MLNVRSRVRLEGSPSRMKLTREGSFQADEDGGLYFLLPQQEQNAAKPINSAKSLQVSHGNARRDTTSRMRSSPRSPLGPARGSNLLFSCSNSIPNEVLNNRRLQR
ncbi:unnamed protein product [Arctogadus glacialis]